MNNLFCRHRRLALVAFFISFAFSSAHADGAATQAYTYLLGAGDKINISVFGRSDLSGVYTIRSSGSVSLPIAGEVKASDHTLDQFEKVVAETYTVLMKSESGPDQAMNVNIEVVKHRPFFIMGDVSKPGSYEYRSGLTVLRAIAIAGGYASSGPSARVDETRARESLNVLMSNYIAGITREARLIAERQGLETIPFPPGLMEMKDDPFVAEIVGIERQLFAVRQDLLEQELEIISKRKIQYVAEDKALAAQAVAVERKRKEVNTLLKGAELLAKKGVLPKFDLASFVIMQSDVERESREIIVSRSRAKQGFSQMEQEALILRGERDREIAAELEKTSLELDEALVHLRAEADRLAILKVKTVSGPGVAGEKTRAAVEISRETAGGVVTVEAGNTTGVLPGDVISIPYQEGDVYLSLPGRAQGQYAKPEKPAGDGD